MQRKKTRKKSKSKSVVSSSQKELLILLATAIAAIFIWNTLLIYPVKLLVVILHEISHALVTIFTGGSVIAMNVSTDLAGGVTSEGGSEFLIASAGYLGSLIFGMLIFFSADNKKLNIWSSTIIAVLLLLFAANFFTNAVVIIFTILYSALFYTAPRYIPQKINYWIMRTLGLLSSMYVLFDIKEDLLTLAYKKNDAQQLAIITSAPAIVWGIIWFILTISAIFFMIKFAYFKRR